MAPSDNAPPFWVGTLCIWNTDASEILNEQEAEELSAKNTIVSWGCLLWKEDASDILNEQA